MTVPEFFAGAFPEGVSDEGLSYEESSDDELPPHPELNAKNTSLITAVAAKNTERFMNTTSLSCYGSNL